MVVYDSCDHVGLSLKRARMMSKKVIRCLVKKVHPRRENPGYAHAGRLRVVRLIQRQTILDQTELLFYE